MKKEKAKNNIEKDKIKDNNVKENKFNKKKIIIYILLLLILIYLAYAIYLLVKQPTNKVTVENGTLYLEETNIGYIIRDEQIVRGNNYKNGMEQIKSEGEKTAKGDSIYRYYSQNEEGLKEEISKLDTQIEEALKVTSNIKSLSDIKSLEVQLDQKLEVLSTITDTSKLIEYKKQINDLISKKAKIIGESSAAGTYLKQLYNQRSKLEEQLNSGAEYIKAPISGIVSYKVDGLEETLTPNNFSALSKDFLEKLNLKTGQLIATSDECGKIIDSSKCYIATISKSEEAKKTQLGKNVSIRLANNKIIDAKISYLAQQNDEEVLVILEIDRQINELANYRKISFDLIWWSSTGLKVPNKAIVEVDGLNYVVRNRAGYLSKILVNVEDRNEKYSIVSNYKTDELKKLGFTTSQIINMKKISIYDELVLNPNLDEIE